MSEAGRTRGAWACEPGGVIRARKQPFTKMAIASAFQAPSLYQPPAAGCAGKQAKAGPCSNLDMLLGDKKKWDVVQWTPHLRPLLRRATHGIDQGSSVVILHRRPGVSVVLDGMTACREQLGVRGSQVSHRGLPAPQLPEQACSVQLARCRRELERKGVSQGSNFSIRHEPTFPWAWNLPTSLMSLAAL